MSPASGGAADFTRDGLRQLLTEFLVAGYGFVSFHEIANAPVASVVLRHDVDVDLRAALEVAEIEHELGVTATYFFLLTSDLYNVRSSGGRDILHRLQALGHSIGVHFDASLYPGADGAVLLDHLLHDRHTLERLTGGAVTMYSLHKPGDRTDVSLHPAPDLDSAYADEYFRDIAYVSDSMGWWRFGRPTEQAFFKERSRGQVALHPIWWTSHDGEHPADRLSRLTESRTAATTESLSETVAPYAHWLAGNESEPHAWPRDVRDDNTE